MQIRVKKIWNTAGFEFAKLPRKRKQNLKAEPIYISYWGFRVGCLGPPHIYCGDRRGRLCLFYVCYRYVYSSNERRCGISIPNPHLTITVVQNPTENTGRVSSLAGAGHPLQTGLQYPAVHLC